MPKAQLKPTVFIGSSTKSLAVAEAVVRHLRPMAMCSLWTNGVFKLSQNTLADLLLASKTFDFGIFVFAPDDELIKGGHSVSTTRDNVLFECGMFYGSAGPARTIFMVPADTPDFHVPSDLLGVTAAYYKLPSKLSELTRALNPTCRIIEHAIQSKSPELGLSYRKLKGKWTQEWEVSSPHFHNVNRSTADVIVIGDTLIATYMAGKQKYRLRGRIQGDTLVTGSYSDSRLLSGYHGTFQLEICPDGRTMNGCWLGWSSSGGVKCGNWRWTKAK